MPSRLDTSVPASRKRSAMTCSTSPTAIDTNVHDTIRFSLAVATLMPSDTDESSPRSRWSAMTDTATLQ